MGRTASAVGGVLILGASLLTSAAVLARTHASPEVVSAARLSSLEQSIAADPENLTLAADYRQLTMGAGLYDRAIDFLKTLAKRKGSGPNVKISLALAYVDKAPPAGDIRRLYLGRDAMNALSQSIADRPCALAYYMRGQINLYYNRFIFHRTDKGVADLTQALSMVTNETPWLLVARIYAALGDGYFRLENFSKARDTWSDGAARFPGDAELEMRLATQGQALADLVTRALSAGRRSDTSLTGFLPVK